MKRRSKILVVRETKLESTMNYNFPPTSMDRISKMKIRRVGEDVQNLKSSYIAGGDAKWNICCGKQFGSSSKS